MKFVTKNTPSKPAGTITKKMNVDKNRDFNVLIVLIRHIEKGIYEDMSMLNMVKN